MKTPLNPLMFAGGSKDLLITVAGRTDVKLRPGKYVITMCGGGGAGGTRSMNSAGNGGAGARGDIQSATITITDTVVATVYVGAGGRTYANGGNGGRSDDSPAPTGKYRGNNIGGFGGGGGYPTYIKIGNRYYFANGGGGGGGGGAPAYGGRYSAAGSGGGGGGYYRLDSTTGQIISVPGQLGARGGGADDGAAAQGVAGNTTDFPGLASGRGGTGGYYKYTRGPGGAGANGGGASGGGGGGGAGNHSSSHGGGGGGGAGGSPDAGGGAAGYGAGYGWGPATNAANHHTTPTPAVDYLGQPVTAGWGIGGYGQTADIAAGNGADGWFYLTRVAAVAKEDFGFINETADEYRDYGNITDPVTETIDYGYLKE